MAGGEAEVVMVEDEEEGEGGSDDDLQVNNYNEDIFKPSYM